MTWRPKSNLELLVYELLLEQRRDLIAQRARARRAVQ